LNTECRMLCACNCAYGIDAEGNFSQDNVKQYYEAVGWKDNPKVISHNSNAALVGENEKDGIIVAFRGTVFQKGSLTEDTAMLKEILQDMDAPLVTREGINGEVHKGFCDGVDDILGELKDALGKISPQALYLTGYGKGGAMAAIFGARLPSQTESTNIYTYASPRPGNKDFVQAFPYPVTRYEYVNDLVPHLPISRIVFKILEKIPGVSSFKFLLNPIDDYASLGKLKLILNNLTIKDIDESSISGKINELWYESRGILRDITHITKLVDFHRHTCGYGYADALCSNECQPKT